MKALMMTLVLTLGITSLACAARRDYGYDRRGSVGVSVGVYRIPQRDVVIVNDYYRGNRLPPGVARNFARGGSLPPGWQRRVRPVPVVMERRLAPLPNGYRRGIYDGAYVVYDSRRGVLVDFFASF